MLASNRNSVGAISHLGRCKLMTGSIEEMIPAQEQAIRLSPRDPNIGVWYYRIGEAHLLQSRVDEAIVWLEKARSANPALPIVHVALASACSLKGMTERAVAELAEARRLSGDDRYSSIARLRTMGLFGSGYWGCQRSAPCSKPLMSPVCARPGCRRNDRSPPQALSRRAKDRQAARPSRQHGKYCASPM
jgi:tetratricopeptide (TPR) repeat protein